MLADGVEILNINNTPEYIIRELTTISRQAGEKSITISSNERTVQKQVEVMLDYYILCTKGKFADKKEICGISLAKQVYHPDCHGGFDLFNAEKSKADNIKIMSKVLAETLIVLGESRICMNHVVVQGIITRYVAIDIKPSSIDSLKRFYLAVKANPKVKQFYYPKIKGVVTSPVKESAFHLEFERQTVQTD